MSEQMGSEYFREYRRLIGFTNQDEAKKFLAAKDVQPEIDDDYINKLNYRLSEIMSKIFNAVPKELRPTSLENFIEKNIYSVYRDLAESGLLMRLNNLGRRREEVYFSWLRGRLLAAFFARYIAEMFGVNETEVKLIGDDEVLDPDVFRKTPTADLEIDAVGKKLRLEVQSGFQGINDIKQHKVIEARRVFQESAVHTAVVHFDVFNGQVALVKISDIQEDDLNWITRQQMEGQTVFNISQNHFMWRINATPNLDLGAFLAS